MSRIAKFPGAQNLTQAFAGLSPWERLRKRRRIEAIAARWTHQLESKHGRGGALAIARRRLVFCVRHAPSAREQIWLRVYRSLRTASSDDDNWFRGPAD